MTRRATDQLARMRSQRRILAAGTRMRGQWRYLVRSTHDPFTLGDHPGEAREPVRLQGRDHRQASVSEERL
ncbi:MAG TPA: hypothetical protein VIS07_18545 [Candidatus Binatia bacterium]